MRMQIMAGKTLGGASLPGAAFVCSARRLGSCRLVLAVLIPSLVVRRRISVRSGDIGTNSGFGRVVVVPGADALSTGPCGGQR